MNGHADFYVAAAQIMPVLFLALSFRRLLPPEDFVYAAMDERAIESMGVVVYAKMEYTGRLRNPGLAEGMPGYDEYLHRVETETPDVKSNVERLDKVLEPVNVWIGKVRGQRKVARWSRGPLRILLVASLLVGIVGEIGCLLAITGKEQAWAFDTTWTGLGMLGACAFSAILLPQYWLTAQSGDGALAAVDSLRPKGP